MRALAWHGIEDVRVDTVPDPVIQEPTDAIVRITSTAICGSDVYGGGADPLPMMQLFDMGVQVRMGQAHVKRWIDDILPLVLDDADPLGTGDLATHRLPLEQAPLGYEIFQKKRDGAIKVVLEP